MNPSPHRGPLGIKSNIYVTFCGANHSRVQGLQSTHQLWIRSISGRSVGAGKICAMFCKILNPVSSPYGHCNVLTITEMSLRYPFQLWSNQCSPSPISFMDSEPTQYPPIDLQLRLPLASERRSAVRTRHSAYKCVRRPKCGVSCLFVHRERYTLMRSAPWPLRASICTRCSCKAIIQPSVILWPTTISVIIRTKCAPR